MSLNANRRLFLTMAGATGVLSASRGLAATTKAPALRYGPDASVAKLNANENPFGPSAAALEAAAEATSRGAYYVGESVPRLKAMIAERNGVSPGNISLSSGSSGVLSFFAVAKSKQGRILGPDLFWDTTAKAAVRQGGELKYMPKTADLAIDLDAMLPAITRDISLVHITNPNNPTGLLLDPAKLKAFCIEASKKATVLVDEAYNELTDDPEKHSMVPLIKAGHDVVVARTFSKIYGLAGMRVGYMIGSEANTALIDQYGLGDYAMNQAGVAAAIACYNDEKFLAKSKSAIVAAREAVMEATTSLGLKPLPSATNFVFVDLGDLDAEKFRAAMARQNVLIRGIYRDYTSWSRVSMGLPRDVDRYIAALPPVLDAVSVTS